MFDKKIMDYTGNDVIVTVIFLYFAKQVYHGVSRGLSPTIESYSDKIKNRMRDQ